MEIYGEGPERNNLLQLIKELDMSKAVFLRGFCNDVHEKILKAACFVLPSNYEGISNSMIEALGLGIPTICTDCPIGGARILIENMTNGILTTVQDQEGLENAICYMLDNPDDARKMSIQALKVRDRLSSSSITRQWMEFIKKVGNSGK